jgi:hypothetical protein
MYTRHLFASAGIILIRSTGIISAPGHHVRQHPEKLHLFYHKIALASNINFERKLREKILGVIALDRLI